MAGLSAGRSGGAASGTASGLLLAPVLLTPAGRPPVRGEGQAQLSVYREAALAWAEGVITYAGPASDLPESARPADPSRVHRAAGAVVPGFVDCHTHLPFFGWRADEFEARLAGRSYRDQHGEGGIYRSARLLAEASEEEVLEFCQALAEEMLAHGTTALELKTGYGLSVEAELRQARLARRLAAEVPQTATVTLLACHAVPAGRSREEWVDEVCRELIPNAAREDLADAVDVYVEDIAFGVDDLRKVAEVARGFGLEVRCHADQLGPSGAAEAAVACGARSADHLNHVSAEGVRALASAETAAVLCPVSTLFLGLPPPPARDLLTAGAAVALATDFNPGTAPCLSVPEAMATAAALYRLLPATALAAATLNAAWVLGLDEGHGSLEPGKRANFLVLDTEDLALVPYRPGHNPVRETWVGGRRVVHRGSRG
ncbi:MAG TPA: imidazolonepropionase [Actinomycetota bacterium]|nr:imidazolonepropionase [Actinomycetota bacterium]